MKFAGSRIIRRVISTEWTAILRSIQSRVLPLADDVTVVTGHGPSTTIGEERAHNPFLRRR